MPNSVKNVFKNNFRIELESEDGITFNNWSSIFQKWITTKNKTTDLDWNSVGVQFTGTADGGFHLAGPDSCKADKMNLKPNEKKLSPNWTSITFWRSFRT